MRILLTASAREFAEAHGWVDHLEALQLGGLVQVGDRLALTDEPEHDFKVIRRRIRVGGEEPALEVTLDFPARG